ncbi:MAG: helix-turn-helix domain-containing protein, partial [Syntrophales bacterium]|nr:helix-turn-helix domain-containing protein [Syntrophales bacterium]
IAARRLFGRYGFHGATTRMIAREVGIDVSTLYYHWGEKGNLYEAVVLDRNDDLRKKLIDLEGVIHGLPLAQRMGIAIEAITDYLFEHPEITNVILSRCFVNIRHESSQNIRVPEYISNIAFSMGLSRDKKGVSVRHKMQVLTIMNAIYAFVSGEEFFRASLGISREEYLVLVKDTLNFILIPAFANSMAEEIKRSQVQEKQGQKG